MDAKVSRLAIGLGILMALSQWSSAQLAQTGGPGGGSVQCFAGNGSSIFAGTWNGGLFQSSASGTPGWAAITSGLPADSWIYSLADTGATMIAGTNTGVYISKNSGTSWAVADTGQLNTGVLSLAVQETGYQMNIFAGTDGHGVYYSSDTGKSWDKVSMDSLTIDSTRIFSLLFNGTILFAAGDSGVYRSSDSIPDWTAVNTGLSSGTSVRSLAMSGSNLYAGTIGGGVYYSSTNVTPSWTQQNSGLSNLNVQSLVVGGSSIYAGTNGGGVFQSSTSGAPSWTAVNTGLPAGALDVISLWYYGSYLYAGTLNGGIYRTSTGTISWTAVNSGLANTYVQSLATSGSYVFAGLGYGGGVVSSTNNGSTWTAINPGQPTDIYNIQSLAASGTNLFAGTDSAGVFESTVSSTPGWTTENSGLTNMHVQSILVNGANLLVGTKGGGVFQSSASGTPSWNAVNSGLSGMYIQSLAICGAYIYAGTKGGGVFQSPATGTPTWTAVNSGLTLDSSLVTLAVSGTSIYAGTDNGVFLSTNNGGSWTPVNTGLSNLFISSLAVSGSNIFAGTFGDTVYLSTNSGASWSVFGATNATILSLAVNSSNLFAGTGGGGVWQANISAYAPPAVPTLASPSNGSINQPSSETLNWSTVGGATSYSVQVSTSSGFSSTVFSASGLATFFATAGGLANNTTYYWQSNAANGNGSGAWSGIWSFTTVGAPGAPSLASPSNGASNQPVLAQLAWTSVSNAASYAVLVSTGSNFGSTVFSVTGLTGLTANTTGLSNITTYYWEVSAANGGGASPWSGVWSFTTTSLVAPGTPTLSTPTNNAINQSVSLSLSWSSMATASWYDVQVSTDAAFGSVAFSQANLTAPVATPGGLVNNTTYYWEANAANIGGTSAWTAVWTFTTVVGAPAAPQLSSPSNNAVAQPVALSLNWGSVGGAASYAVQLSTTSGFSSTVMSLTGLTALTAAVSGLTNNTSYYWQVNASDIGGAGIWSAAWTFTTLTNFTMPLAVGWNIFSMNIHPADSGVGTVFGDSQVIANHHNFILVKNIGGEVYSPTIGLNNLSSTNTGEGYQVFSDSTDTIRLAGAAIATATTPLLLVQGWNLFAYLPQAPMPITTALQGIVPQILIVKNNAGQIYWPDYGINALGTMTAGQGYFAYMKDSITLIYDSTITVAKKLAGAGAPQLSLPNTVHYEHHGNTGNNASILASRVIFGNQVAPDSGEIGAFDAAGNLVGSGSILHGLAAFTVWGKNTQTKQKDGLNVAEPITFKLWTKTGEYSATFKNNNGTSIRYAAQGIFVGSLIVPEGELIKEFNLARVYPNPCRGAVSISFDVPTLSGAARQDIEINIFTMNGSIVHQVVKGKYPAGRYTVSWGGESSGNAFAGSGVYVVQMKAANFDKRLKLIRVE